MTLSDRKFEAFPAKRERVPLLIGIVGPSGSGKTYSALRLATGIQAAVGGDIYYCDSEARRALHYADKFKFMHVPFGAPFDPLSYLAMLEFCRGKGAKTIVVDSMSHEHEGAGGVLEMHDAEADALVKRWRMPDTDASREKVKMSAWQKPKGDRRRLIQAILQMNVNFIFCFRAKEKLKIVGGDKPVQLGWMPIAGEEFIYEMTVNCLLYPNGGGVPQWHPAEMGEKAIIKLPSQFKDVFAKSQPLSEDIGQKLAAWAAGDTKSTPPSPPPAAGSSAESPAGDGGTSRLGALPEASGSPSGPTPAADANPGGDTSAAGVGSPPSEPPNGFVEEAVLQAKARALTQKFVKQMLQVHLGAENVGTVRDMLGRLDEDHAAVALGLIKRAGTPEYDTYLGEMREAGWVRS